MKTVIVLGMHGTPPSDFPRAEMAEFFGGHHEDHSDQNQHSERNEHGQPTDHADQKPAPEDDETRRQRRRQRRAELDAKMRAWPRTPANDPFFAGSLELAEYLSQASGHRVLVGFNEFCNPTIDTAIDQAVEQGADQVVVITPMMTRGGEHSEADIPGAVERGRARHPAVRMSYAWPFEITAVAQFLAAQVQRFAE
jgi:sirohydrochlorin cobaltochelatase